MTTATDPEWERYGLSRQQGRQMLEVRETVAKVTEAEARVPLSPAERSALLAMSFRIHHGLRPTRRPARPAETQ